MTINDIPAGKRAGAVEAANIFLIQKILGHMLANDQITKADIAAFRDGMPEGHARTVAENTLRPFTG